MHSASLTIHAGKSDQHAVGSPVTPSITTSTSFYASPDTGGLSPTAGNVAPDFYTRWGNPTVTLLEQRMAALEHAEAAVCFASGMAAVTGLFWSRLKPGDHLVVSDVCYPGVAEFARETLPRFGISVTALNTADPAKVAAGLRPETRLVHVETPGNPILKLTDIAAVARIAHDAGAELSVDSTIGTPMATQPLTLGADYVIHSLTKYACGHGDALGGVIACSTERAAALRHEALVHHGGAMNPIAAWLIARGVETLAVRMRTHEENARRVAQYLSTHPRLGAVYWPGLPSHPQHELARRQMRNFSGMIAFTAKEDSASLARRLAQRSRLFSYAVSLGKTQSLIFYIQTDALLRNSFGGSESDAAAYRAWAGEGVFRVSVGLEDSEDLINDLKQAIG